MPGPLMVPVRGVILADGDADDMAPIVSDAQPKALLPVANKPLLSYAVLSLKCAGIENVTVVSPSSHAESIQMCVDEMLAGDAKSMKIDVFSSEAGGTADSLRTLFSSNVSDESHSVVFSAGTVLNCSLGPLLDQHIESGASCTALFAEKCPPAQVDDVSEDAKKAGKGGKKGGEKGGAKNAAKKKEKVSSKSVAFEAEMFVTADTSSSRLVGMVDAGDLDDDGLVNVPPSLLRRFSSVSVRSDLLDTNVYVFAPWVLQRLLGARPRVSSVSLDLVPYLARRQFTLSRSSDNTDEDWARYVPAAAGGDVIVAHHVEPFGTFVRRIATCETYIGVNLEVANGALANDLGFTNVSRKVPGKDNGAGKEKKKGGGRGEKPVSPFVNVADKTNVSSDSTIGSNCSAGDRTSVKKSCVADNVVFGANVKLNGCVVLMDVEVGDGVSLSACVVGAGAKIEGGCNLKNCRVASGVTVPSNTEAEGTDYDGMDKQDASGLGDAFEFCFS